MRSETDKRVRRGVLAVTWAGEVPFSACIGQRVLKPAVQLLLPNDGDIVQR